MAEGAGLENRKGVHSPARVRISNSPPKSMKLFQEIGTFYLVKAETVTFVIERLYKKWETYMI